MPSRNNHMIRRDINRLKDVITRRGAEEPALMIIADDITSAADKVNTAWQAFQEVSVTGDKERGERDTAIGELVAWIQRWRPVIMIKVPGAEKNIKNLPVRGATPDDAVRVAEDMVKFMNSNTVTAGFLQSATDNLGDKLVKALKEVADATAVLPQEALCRNNFTQACLDANSVLLRGLDIVRSAFGRTSPEYKQFIARAASEEEEEEPAAVQTGVSS